MNYFAIIWGGGIFLIGVSSTIYLFYKLRKLQIHTENEINELRQELLNEIQIIGNLDKTESGQKLKNMLSLDKNKYANINSVIKRKSFTIPTFDNFKTYAIIIITCIVIFSLVQFSPTFSFDVETALPFLWLTIGIFLITVTAQIVFPVQIYEKARETNLSAANKGGFAYTIESLYQVKTRGFKANKKYWWHLTWFNTTVSISVSMVITFWIIIVVIAITITMFIVIHSFLQK